MLKIAIAQYSLKKHDTFEAFKINAEEWIKEAADNGVRLAVFPEYGSIELVSLMPKNIQQNLSLQLLEIQKFKKDFLQCYIDLATRYQLSIVAPSFPLQIENSKFINRAYVIYPDGNYEYQDKQMMTRFEDEEWCVSPPIEKKLTLFSIDGVKMGMSICFDVEFPDFARELAMNGIVILLAPSCTETLAGMNRVHIGARARALENQFYVVVSQTVGEVDYSEAIDKNVGMSAVYSTCDKGFPDDGIIARGELNKSQWIYATIDPELIASVREKGSVFNFKKIKVIPT